MGRTATLFIAFGWATLLAVAVLDLGRGGGFEPYRLDITQGPYADGAPLAPRVFDVFRGRETDLGNLCTLPARLAHMATDVEDAAAAVDALEQFGIITVTSEAGDSVTIGPGRWTSGPWSSIVKAATFRETYSCYRPWFSPYIVAFVLLSLLAVAVEFVQRNRDHKS